MKSKKADIGATMTWIVATIIILFVIIFFVYATKTFVISADIKDFLKNFWKSSEKSSFSSVKSEQMLLALLETKINGKILTEHLNEEDWEKNLKEIEKEIHEIVKRFPENSKKEGWSLEIGDKSFGVIPIQGHPPEKISEISFINLKNIKISLFKVEK